MKVYIVTAFDEIMGVHDFFGVYKSKESALNKIKTDIESFGGEDECPYEYFVKEETLYD